MKILIVSFLFPPANNIGALRVGKTAKHLHEMGHDLRVLTAVNTLYANGLSVEIPSNKVICTKWFDVNKFFYFIKNEKINSGLTVSNKNIYKGIRAHIYGFLRGSYKYFLHRPDSVIGWLPYALYAGDKLFKDWTPDIIYASGAPYTSLLVAGILSTRYHIPWIAELRDLWSDNSYKRSDYIERLIEKKVLSCASVLVTVSDALCNTLLNMYKQPCYVVKNAFDPEDMSDLPSPHFPKEKINITYTGLVYKGRQDPSILFHAISRSDILRNKLLVRFYGDSNEWVKDMADSYGIGENVLVFPSVSWVDSLIFQKASDILLFLTWNHPLEKGILSGKIFEYIGIGRPVITVGDYDDEATKIISDNLFGFSFHDPDSLSEFLVDFIKKPYQLPTVAVVNREKYSRLHQVQKLFSIFEFVVLKD
jgi:glycosyltransferase involved in cell wall biosynthesis